MSVVPGGTEVFQVETGGIHRGNLGSAFRCVDREDRRGSFRGGIAQPGLCGSDEASGGFNAATLSETTDDLEGRRGPGQSKGIFCELAGPGQIERGFQEGLRAHLAWLNELGNGEYLDRLV
jgi:hypothetical protein